MRLVIHDREFNLPPLLRGAGGGFAFALHKGGSVLLDGALKRLIRGTEMTYFSLSSLLAQNNISVNLLVLDTAQKIALRDYFSCSGNVFGGWRIYPKAIDLPTKPSTKTFLQVRDPRDILTSYYFHLKSSAREEGPNASRVKAFRDAAPVDIDAFVLSEATDFLSRYMSYGELGNSSDMLLRRYEDVIFDKATLLRNLCSHFGIDVRPNKIARIVEILDKIPKRENESSHVRQVIPGDHKRKLKPETIEQLNHIFAPILTRYGYSI